MSKSVSRFAAAGLVAAASLFLLAACGGGGVPLPTPGQSVTTSRSPIEATRTPIEPTGNPDRADQNPDRADQNPDRADQNPRPTHEKPGRPDGNCDQRSDIGERRIDLGAGCSVVRGRASADPYDGGGRLESGGVDR